MAQFSICGKFYLNKWRVMCGKFPNIRTPCCAFDTALHFILVKFLYFCTSWIQFSFLSLVPLIWFFLWFETRTGKNHRIIARPDKTRRSSMLFEVNLLFFFKWKHWNRYTEYSFKLSLWLLSALLIYDHMYAIIILDDTTPGQLIF